MNSTPAGHRAAYSGGRAGARGGRGFAGRRPLLLASGRTIAAGLQAPLRPIRHDCRACWQRPAGGDVQPSGC